MSENYIALILDMNDTFMFGADRFDADQDFNLRYKELGGSRLDSTSANYIIRKTYDKLLEIYPHPAHRENFPKVKDTIGELLQEEDMPMDDIGLLTDTFAYHELGHVPLEYAQAVRKLSRKYRLGLVADIWSEKSSWLDELSGAGLTDLFEVMLFSSDSGIVKPSPKPFLSALNAMGINSSEALVVGDSVRRDMGGAAQASIGCILVGGATHPDCYGTAASLIELSETGVK